MRLNWNKRKKEKRDKLQRVAKAEGPCAQIFLFKKTSGSSPGSGHRAGLRQNGVVFAPGEVTQNAIVSSLLFKPHFYFFYFFLPYFKKNFKNPLKASHLSNPHPARPRVPAVSWQLPAPAFENHENLHFSPVSQKSKLSPSLFNLYIFQKEKSRSRIYFEIKQKNEERKSQIARERTSVFASPPALVGTRMGFMTFGLPEALDLWRRIDRRWVFIYLLFMFLFRIK